MWLLLVIWTVLTLPCFTFSIAADFLPTYMYCLGSRDFEVVQTALRNLPEYTLLCQGELVSATFGVLGLTAGLLCWEQPPQEVSKGQCCLGQAIRQTGDLYQ